MRCENHQKHQYRQEQQTEHRLGRLEAVKPQFCPLLVAEGEAYHLVNQPLGDVETEHHRTEELDVQECVALQ